VKPTYRRIYFAYLPRHIKDEFVSQRTLLRARGWARFVSGDYTYIMNRRDEWYAAKYG
jgi:hypothetical protein